MHHCHSINRSDRAKKLQVQEDPSGFRNPRNENNAQSHAVDIRKQQEMTVALRSFPTIQTVRNRQNVVPTNPAHVTVTIPYKRQTYDRTCKTSKIARNHENNRNIALLEALMKLLRHKTPSDIAVDHEGFAYVEDILKHRQFQKFSLSGKEIYDMVKNDNKTPFAIKGGVDDFQIRAIWGHSFDLEAKSLDQGRS